MRVITTLFFFLCLFTSSQAQYNKGAKLVGGQFSIVSTKDKSGSNNQPTYTNADFQPRVGMFYQNNRLAGVSLSYGVTTYKDVPDNYSYGAGLFLRQYFPLAKSSFSFFTEQNGRVSFGKYNTSSDPGNNERVKRTDVLLGFTPAFAYGPSKRLQLELFFTDLLNLRYSRHKAVEQTPNGTNYSQFVASMGVTSFGLGASLLF